MRWASAARSSSRTRSTRAGRLPAARQRFDGRGRAGQLVDAGAADHESVDAPVPGVQRRHRELWTRGRAGQQHDPAAEGQQVGGQLQVDAPGGVHLQVDAVRRERAQALTERVVAVVEHLGGACSAAPVGVGGPAGGEHPGARHRGEPHQRAADVAGRAADQDRLAGPQLTVLVKGEVSGGPGCSRLTASIGSAASGRWYRRSAAPEPPRARMKVSIGLTVTVWISTSTSVGPMAGTGSSP
jgi:hypothetical protein